MSTAEDAIRLVGRTELAPSSVAVEVGRISLEIEDRSLRNVRIDGFEVISRLYVGIRDPVWDTLVGELVESDLHQDDDVVTYTCRSVHQVGDIDFSWQGTARAHADGTLEFVMDGVSGGEFDYARIGINLLSPGGFGGLPYRVKTELGYHGAVLPEAEIAPQAWMDGEFYAMTLPFSELSVFPPGGELRFTFEGDLFEIEDQRNWTDATFKTYSTPMSLGMRHAQPGDMIRQRLVVTPPFALRAPRRARGDRTALTADWNGEVSAPSLGLCHTLADRSLSPHEADILRPLALAHLRVELPGIDASSIADAKRAALDARELNAGVELALHLAGAPSQAELDTLRGAVDVLPIVRLLVFETGQFVTPGELTERVRDALAGSVPVYGGTDLNFADVNRDRPDPATCDGVAFGINAQVHSFDERSVVETLAVQGAVVRAARATFAAATSLAVSPVTMRPRFNPDAPDQLLADSGLPYAVDPRQSSLFCAAWTVGSLASLWEACPDSITYFGTVGWQGVAERDEGAAAPELFHSSPGTVYPVYHVFRAIADLPASSVVPVRSSNPLAVVGFGLRAGTNARMVLANVTPDPQAFTLDAGPGAASWRVLDITTADLAAADPEAWLASSTPVNLADELEFAAYATAVIDFAQCEP